MTQDLELILYVANEKATLEHFDVEDIEEISDNDYMDYVESIEGGTYSLTTFLNKVELGEINLTNCIRAYLVGLDTELRVDNKAPFKIWADKITNSCVYDEVLWTSAIYTTLFAHEMVDIFRKPLKEFKETYKNKDIEDFVDEFKRDDLNLAIRVCKIVKEIADVDFIGDKKQAIEDILNWVINNYNSEVLDFIKKCNIIS